MLINTPNVMHEYKNTSDFTQCKKSTLTWRVTTRYKPNNEQCMWQNASLVYKKEASWSKSNKYARSGLISIAQNIPKLKKAMAEKQYSLTLSFMKYNSPIIVNIKGLMLSKVINRLFS